MQLYHKASQLIHSSTLKCLQVSINKCHQVSTSNHLQVSTNKCLLRASINRCLLQANMCPKYLMYACLQASISKCGRYLPFNKRSPWTKLRCKAQTTLTSKPSTIAKSPAAVAWMPKLGSKFLQYLPWFHLQTPGVLYLSSFMDCGSMKTTRRIGNKSIPFSA